MAKNQTTTKSGTIPPSNCWIPRNMRRGGPPKSQTPGSAKNEYCKKSPIGGLPRSAWTRARAYKHRNYHIWCEFGDKAK